MLSRVASQIYWISRYIERAENVARFIDVNLHLMLDLPVKESEQWEPLVKITADQDAFKKRYDVCNQENVVFFLAFDLSNPNSIISSLYKARENARAVRSVISSEMWEQVNRFYHLVNNAAEDRSSNLSLHRFFTQVKIASHLFCGITDATMSHDEGWNFAQLGRYLERADKTSRLLDVKYYMLLPSVEYVGTPFDNIQWSAVLKSASAFEAYRKTCHRITPYQVSQFLIFSRFFPRAIRHCLVQAETSLHSITGNVFGTFTNPAEKQLGRVRSEIEFTEFAEVVSIGTHEFLDEIQGKLNGVGEAVYHTFFAIGTPESIEETGFNELNP